MLAVELSDDTQGEIAHSVLLVDYETREVLATLEGVDASWRLNFSPDGSLLAAGGANGLVTLIDPETRTPEGRRLQGVDGPVIAMAFSADSKLLVTSSFDGTVELWDLERHAARRSSHSRRSEPSDLRLVRRRRRQRDRHERERRDLEVLEQSRQLAAASLCHRGTQPRP